jgi:hypothetical protein
MEKRALHAEDVRSVRELAGLVEYASRGVDVVGGARLM